MQLPQPILDYLNQLAQTNGIPLQDLLGYYEKHLSDAQFLGVFGNDQAKAIEYLSQNINVFIQEFHSFKLEDFEVFVIRCDKPRPTKTNRIMSNMVALAKRGDQKPKMLSVMSFEDNGQIFDTPPLTTGKMSLSIISEDDFGVSATTRPNSTFTPQNLTWIPIPLAERKEYLLNLIRKVDIAQAGQNVSPKQDGIEFANPFGLRRIHGIISVARTIQIDNGDGKIREMGMINIVDKSVGNNPDFFKNKTVPDPKDASKTKTIYGGFGGIVDLEVVKIYGKGTEGDYIGYINDAHNMQICTILPTLVFAPKKPTERIQKPSQPVGINPAAL